MPEFPDLEVVKESLRAAPAGHTGVRVGVRPPLVMRDALGEPVGTTLGRREACGIGRWDRFLWLDHCGGLWSVVAPKLAGRPRAKRDSQAPLGPYTAVLSFSSAKQLHFLEAKAMGQSYATGAPMRWTLCRVWRPLPCACAAFVVGSKGC